MIYYEKPFPFNGNAADFVPFDIEKQAISKDGTKIMLKSEKPMGKPLTQQEAAVILAADYWPIHDI